MYCNATIYSDFCFDAPYLELSLNQRRSCIITLQSLIKGFDAPYLELSLNPVHKYKYKYKFEIIDYICFDAPYLELSLNPETTANSI